MNENEQNIQNTENAQPDGNHQQNGADDYIEALNDMRKNTVPRADYDKLVAEKSKLIKALAAGQKPDEEGQKRTSAEIRKSLIDNGRKMTNLQYVKTSLELREAVMDEGGTDPFVPYGDHYTPTEEDFDVAERVAGIYQDCINEADGNDEKFTALLASRIPNDMPKPRR